MTLDPDPLEVQTLLPGILEAYEADDARRLNQAYVRGFLAGLQRRDRQLVRIRRMTIAAVILAIGLGILVGFLFARSSPAFATSLPGAQPPVPAGLQTETPTARALVGASSGAVAVQPAAAPTAGTVDPLCSPSPCPTLAPRPTPAALIVEGKASTYGPGWDGWLAWPDGPGWRLRICGAAGCVTDVSNDAGPDKERQRAGVVIDLDVATFEDVCGVPWRMGHCPVHVTVLGRG